MVLKSMHDLFRRSSFLFWQYPILWVPVVLSDLIVMGIRQLQNRAAHAIVAGLAHHSALTGAPEALQHVTAALSITLGITRLLVEFSNTCLYVAAMLAISVLVQAFVSKRTTSWREVFLAVKKSFTRILFLSVKIVTLLTVATVTGALAVSYLLTHTRITTGAQSVVLTWDYGITCTALLFAAVAYLIAPAAVAFLRPPGDRAKIRLARISAVLATLVSVAGYMLAIRLEPSFISQTAYSIGVDAYWCVASLITAIPYILLFIALSLIAATDSPDQLFTEEIVAATPSL